MPERRPGRAGSRQPGGRWREVAVAATAALSGFAAAWLLARDPRPAKLKGLAPPDTKPWEALEGEERVLPPAGHERSDVGFAPMLAAGGLMLAAVGGMLLAVRLLYPSAAPGSERAAPVAPFPAPVLQTNVPADMAAFRDRQLRDLHGAYWTDKERGRVHMPIEDAMLAVAQQGIPDWPRTAAGARTDGAAPRP